MHVPIDLEHDVEVDDDGISYLISNVYLGERYQHLYVVAHEFSCAAEALREKAGLIEDSVSAVSDLFCLTVD